MRAAMLRTTTIGTMNVKTLAAAVAAVQTGVTHYVDAVWGQIAVLALAVVVLQLRRHHRTMVGAP